MNDIDEKRVYSFNLAAYIIVATDVYPEIEEENGLFYCRFPQDCRGIAYAICQWKNPKLAVDIHKYLTAYRWIRDTINQMRKK